MKNGPLKTIGLMSGTSLDGVDAAILDTDGVEISGFGAAISRPYLADERTVLENATQDALAWDFKGPMPVSFAQARRVIHKAHRAAIHLVLKAAALKPSDIDLIGFHGQTVVHRPPKNGICGQTLQLGDGQGLADTLGIDTVFDFRSDDMRAGGQGAPLAPLYHTALVKGSRLCGVTAVLNIGGVSNVTLIKDGAVLLASDCGPGNGPLDTWVSGHNLGPYDKDGLISLNGTPDIGLIEQWLKRDFFTAPLPKSADRWDFNRLSDLDGARHEDGAATLAAFCAHAIGHTLRQCNYAVDNIVVCGGGRLNPAIMAALLEQNIGRVMSAEAIGWLGDDIEAQAFAYLAVRSIRGLPLSLPQTTGVRVVMPGGRLASCSGPRS